MIFVLYLDFHSTVPVLFHSVPSSELFVFFCFLFFLPAPSFQYAFLVFSESLPSIKFSICSSNNLEKRFFSLSRSVLYYRSSLLKTGSVLWYWGTLKGIPLYANVKLCLWYPKLYQILEFLLQRGRRSISAPKMSFYPLPLSCKSSWEERSRKK